MPAPSAPSPDVTALFDDHRRRLFGLAYRMLGSVSDAEDMVQETYLRWHRAKIDKPDAGGAWLTTTMTRLCIDHLRSAKRDRADYVGPWLPEPVVTESEPTPLDRVELDETLSIALLMVLDKLSPNERAAFLLHDVFDYDYAKIAEILTTSTGNCRQMASRARRRLRADRPRLSRDRAEGCRLFTAFAAACQTGDMQNLLQLLSDDVIAHCDGGGQALAALNPIYGADKVARFLLGLMKKAPADAEFRTAEINGDPGVIGYQNGIATSTLSLAIADDAICHIHLVTNPDKLRHLPPL